ncbi:MAG TPA: hypothetical protein ENI96_10340 [Sedimenticola thiotaurini]|uniref:LPS-assembly lipoprotein LptE n=1 Tax=Sedimenticola thiotaurini TaxID=1543721 RepID=A0A831W600_9GAMM|nr:hypothetical protein [Sedimenticola thiotaurini]
MTQMSPARPARRREARRDHTMAAPPSRGRLPWLLLLLPLLLQGCGFHLRGTGGDSAGGRLPAAISPVYIQGVATGDRLYPALAGALRAGGAGVTTDPAAAASRLLIDGRRSDRRVLSVDSRGKVLEYQLDEGLRFRLVTADGAERVKPQSIDVVQTYLSADVLVLGKAEEERTLRVGMYQRIADQLVRRLVAQLR